MWRRGENIYVAKDYDAGKKTRYVISDLDPNIVYELRVFGYSRGGVGLQSSPIIEFVLGNIIFHFIVKSQLLKNTAIYVNNFM